MSEAKHTPGPWRELPEEDTDYIRIRGTQLGRRYKIANVLSVSYPGNDMREANAREASETQANARLIAAAPDMLSALERLTHSYRLLLAGKPVRDVEETLAEVDAAISKATEAA